MRSFTDEERRARLARRHFLSAPAPSVVGVAASFVGLHATDPATPYLTLWARSPGFSVDDLDTAVYRDRTVLKHLAMRRTLWMVTAGDLPLIQSAASDRVADTEHRRLVADAEKAGVTADGEAWFAAAAAAVLNHLTAHGPVSARGLREELTELAGSHDAAPGKRWGGPTPLAPRVLTVLGARGDIVRGPNDGRWTASRPRWTTMAEWLPNTPVPVSPELARAELVRRWLSAFGPATVADVKWWFGQTLTWARQALSEVDAVPVDLAGSTGYALPEDVEPDPADADVEPWCALLPALDVTTMGWLERNWYVGAHRDQVFDRNGNAGPTVWVDGRVVGAWRQDDTGRVELVLLEDVGRRAHRELTARAEGLTAWLDGVRVSPRFPSPACRPDARR